MEGDLFLTFSVITATVGPPHDPTIGATHETVARLVMSKRMAVAVRDLLNRQLPPIVEDGQMTDDGEPEGVEVVFGGESDD
jgi:hypothetical protein